MTLSTPEIRALRLQAQAVSRLATEVLELRELVFDLRTEADGLRADNARLRAQLNEVQGK